MAKRRAALCRDGDGRMGWGGWWPSEIENKSPRLQRVIALETLLVVYVAQLRFAAARTRENTCMYNNVMLVARGLPLAGTRNPLKQPYPLLCKMPSLPCDSPKNRTRVGCCRAALLYLPACAVGQGRQ